MTPGMFVIVRGGEHDRRNPGPTIAKLEVITETRITFRRLRGMYVGPFTKPDGRDPPVTHQPKTLPRACLIREATRREVVARKVIDPA